MDLGLHNKIAIVTGGSRGIGHACARELMAEGAKVVLVSRDPDRLEQARLKLEKETGASAIAISTDLRDDASVKSMVDQVCAELGSPDILINAAATVTPTDFLEMDDAAFQDVYEQKLNGYARCLRYTLPLMKQSQWGRVVNIAGLAGRQPHVTTIPVNLNNASVLSLSKALATQYAGDGIRINAVVPHIIQTDRQDETMEKWAKITGQSEDEVRAERIAKIPAGRMGEAHEVAAVVAFLASEKASFVVGAVWHVDGGVAVSM